MQPAARVGDMHTCPMATPATPPVPHVGGPVLPPGGITVLIGGQPAARMGDMCTCVGPPDVIAQGAPTVLICGQPAARQGDVTSHGGVIAMGFPTVLIGASAAGGGAAASPGAPGAGGQGSGEPDSSEGQESCFQCRQGLAAAGMQSSDPAVRQAAENMNRLNHDMEHAKLANHVYKDGSPPDYKSPPDFESNPAPEGWSEVTDPAELEAMGIDPADLSDQGSNFRARVYKPDPAVFGDSMKPTVTFKGTTFSSGEDWKNNAQQGLGMHSDYYERAVRIGNNSSGVEFTGHSLGGGMASAASRANGGDGTTFNAAGLHSKTVKKYGGTPQNSDINAYQVNNEVLTGVQEQGWKGTAAAAAAGWAVAGPWGALAGALAKIGLSAAAPDAAGTKHALPGHGDPVSRHGMDQVLDGMQGQIEDTQQTLEDATGVECDC